MTDKAKMSVSDAKVVDSSPLDPAKAKWIKMTELTYHDPSGRERKWEAAERSTRPKGAAVDGVGIVAILHDGSKGDDAEGPRILLQKQFRAPVNRVCIEVPAGLLDPAESVETCALRELKEETGYVGEMLARPAHAAGAATDPRAPVADNDNWDLSPVMWNDPGFCTTNTQMLHVSVDVSRPENRDPEPDLEDGEFIECFTVPLKSLYEACRRLEREGYAIDARVGTLAEGVELARRFAL